MILLILLFIFCLGLYQPIVYDNGSKLLDNDVGLLDKNIGYIDGKFHVSATELSNQRAYLSLTTMIVNDANDQLDDYTNDWFYDDFVYMYADNVGIGPLTSDYTKHRFRINNGNIYILFYTGQIGTYTCVCYVIRPLVFPEGSCYFLDTYRFDYGGINIDNIPLSYFNGQLTPVANQNCGIIYPMYISTSPFTNNRLWEALQVLNINEEGNYEYGYASGFIEGQNTRSDEDYNAGYQAGLVDGAVDNPELASIFTGIFNIGLLPVNVFLTMFNYEIFGINVSGIVSGLLTMSIIIIVVRFLFGGKKDD